MRRYRSRLWWLAYLYVEHGGATHVSGFRDRWLVAQHHAAIWRRADSSTEGAR